MRGLGRTARQCAVTGAEETTVKRSQVVTITQDEALWLLVFLQRTVTKGDQELARLEHLVAKLQTMQVGAGK